MAEYKTPVLIIGSGPAGYTAGIYAARAGLKPIIVSGEQIGGQLTITTDVENYPGFPSPIAGTELMHNMRVQAHNVGVQIVDDKIIEVDFNHQPFECNSEKFRGFGVSGCATCDGFFYRNRDVAVVGGGNTAVDEAIYLTNFAKSVTLIHRRDSLRADKTLQERLFENPKINVEWDSVVEEVVGTENPLSVTGLKIKNVKTDQSKLLKVDGVFIAIGHHPNTELFRDSLKLDKDGYIITEPNSGKTNIEGVFAAGDVKDPYYRQAVIAAASGCIAALEAEKYLVSKK